MEGGWAASEVELAASEAEERPRVDSAEEGGSRDDLEEQRRRLCLDFASISNSGAAAAERYLAENGWDMQKALNSYFDPPPEQDLDGVPHPVPATAAPFEFHHGDYEKQFLHVLSRKDKTGIVINNPNQSVFLFIDRQHLQTPKNKATIFKLCSICLYLPQEQLTHWAVGSVEDHLRPYMPE